MWKSASYLSSDFLKRTEDKTGSFQPARFTLTPQVTTMSSPSPSVEEAHLMHLGA
jgi:hypothetical protein